LYGLETGFQGISEGGGRRIIVVTLVLRAGNPFVRLVWGGVQAVRVAEGLADKEKRMRIVCGKMLFLRVEIV
jgi:hypothetical protein